MEAGIDIMHVLQKVRKQTQNVASEIKIIYTTVK